MPKWRAETLFLLKVGAARVAPYERPRYFEDILSSFKLVLLACKIRVRCGDSNALRWERTYAGFEHGRGERDKVYRLLFVDRLACLITAEKEAACLVLFTQPIPANVLLVPGHPSD